VNTLKPLSVFATDRQLSCARFSPDGAVLAAGAIDGTARRWRVGEKQLDPLPHLAGHHGWVSAVAFHPRVPWLFTADTWGQLRCQTFAADAPQTVWRLDAAYDGWLRQIAVTTGHIATCGRDRFIRVWTPDGKLAVEHQHDDDVFALTFAPDARRFVVASTNRISNGNGRRTDKDGGYPANTSPVSLFELPA
jgi:WD40 repeat protein